MLVQKMMQSSRIILRGGGGGKLLLTGMETDLLTVEPAGKAREL